MATAKKFPTKGMGFVPGAKITPGKKPLPAFMLPNASTSKVVATAKKSIAALKGGRTAMSKKK